MNVGSLHPALQARSYCARSLLRAPSMFLPDGLPDWARRPRRDTIGTRHPYHSLEKDDMTEMELLDLSEYEEDTAFDWYIIGIVSYQQLGGVLACHVVRGRHPGGEDDEQRGVAVRETGQAWGGCVRGRGGGERR